MKNILNVATKTLLLVSAISTISTAIANEDYPNTYPDGRGGLITEIKAVHFENTNYGYMNDSNDYVLPRIGQIRGGCAFYTPIIPVFHDDGLADISIKLQGTWHGFIDYTKEDEVSLFRVSVKTPNNPNAAREYMHTGLMHKTVDYTDSDGINHFIARTFNTSGNGWATFNINDMVVKKGETVQLKVCGIEAGSEFTFREVKVHTYPTNS